MFIDDYQVDPVTGLRVRETRKPRVKASSYERNYVKTRLLSMRKRAEQMGLDFDLDVEWLESKMSLTHCEVTCLPFNGSGSDAYAMTIDREDSSVGYTKANCRAVIWMYNNAKGKFSHEELMIMVEALSARFAQKSSKVANMQMHAQK